MTNVLVSVSTPQKVAQINEIVRKDRRMSIWMIAEVVKFYTTNWTRRKSVRSCSQKMWFLIKSSLVRQPTCSAILERLEKKSPNWWKTSSPAMKHGYVQYDVETKRQSMHWRLLHRQEWKRRNVEIQIQSHADRFLRKKRPTLWKNKSWILHHDNAPGSVRRYLATPIRHSPVLEHAPYSTDLAPCKFYLSPKIKSAWKGTRRFESME